jgi:hypothetical protein
LSKSYSVSADSIHAAARPRLLFLPHTAPTIRALLHYLYTSSLPPPTSQFCTPQILCSLLQIARPYRVDGLLEAVVERLHSALDNRNTAAIFNAAAMAAGGGEGVEFFRGDVESDRKRKLLSGRPESPTMNLVGGDDREKKLEGQANDSNSLDRQNLPRLNTEVSTGGPSSARPGTSHSATSASEDETSSAHPNRTEVKVSDVWTGNLSAVVGLQKRGLRGLMEGRRIREMGSRDTATSAGSGERVGLGIG